jgi:hypothetical protein
VTDLLDFAIKAHGGLDRWHEINTIDVDLSITGAIWYLKSKPNVLENIKMRVYTGEELVTTEFTDRPMRTTFAPDRVTVEVDGAVTESRDDPEASFAGQQIDSPWDDVHVAYFSGEALWTYLNTPFIYARADFSTEEIEAIQVDGETWRRLQVTFPDSVKSHTRNQISCFGPDGLLRRHDYTVDILGGGTGLNYATNYADVDGIVVPMTRRIYAYVGDYELVPEPLLVAIDINQISLNP